MSRAAGRKVRPSQRLRLISARAHDLERRRDAAVFAGDRDAAHLLHLELEAVAAELSRGIAAQVRGDRETATVAKASPSADMRAGRRLIRADVPADRLDDAEDRPLSVPGGTFARPVWSIDMPPALKFTAATYAAWTEEAAGAGTLRCVDPGQIRVDGGGAGGSPETRLLWIAGRVRAAHRALDGLPGLSALRAHQAGRLRSFTARQIVDGVVILERTPCEILRAGGWHAKSPRNRDRLLSILIEGLGRIAIEWAGASGGGAGRPETWYAEGADLVVGPAGFYQMSEKTA